MKRRVLILVVTILTIGTAMSGWQARDTGVASADQTSGTGVLTGVVLTDTAVPQPVRRATVRLSADTVTTPRLVGTDDRGRFVFEGLPAGRFTVSAAKTGFVQTFHGSTRPGRGPGVPVAVAAGQTVDISLRLLPGGVITGMISNTAGTPIAGVNVAAVDTRLSSGTPVPIRGVTDDRGQYRLFGLAPGEYVVSALPQLQPASTGRGGPATATVTAVDAADVQAARAAGASGFGSTPGTAAAVGAGRPVAYAPVFYPGTTDAAAATTVRVASGEERTGVDMPMLVVSLARLAGTIVDGSGQPLTNASVSLVPKRGDRSSPVDALVASGALAMPRAIASASGFAFAGVAPGQYTLVARTGGVSRGLAAADAGAPTLWSVFDLTVDGSDRSDLALRLLPGVKVSGRYGFEKGVTPPPGAQAMNLSFVSTNPLPGVASVFRAAVQPDGTFAVPSLAPGAYLVRADVPVNPNGGSWTVKSAVVKDRDLADRPLEAVAGGAEIPDVLVTFTDRAGDISGRLIDATGRPVTRYTIVVFTQDRTLWVSGARRIRAMQPATDGAFAFAGLPAGEYSLAAVDGVEPEAIADPAILSQLIPSAVKISLAEGERRHQDLKVGG